MAPFTKTDFIWMNGKLMPWDDAQVHVTAHALQYGTGVFEGMRSYDTPDGPAIFRLDAHMNRFKASADAYEIDIPYSVDELSAASLDVIRANHLDNAYLRPLAFFDSHSFSVWPKDCPVSVAIIAVPGRAYIQGGPDHGIRVMRVVRPPHRRVDAAAVRQGVRSLHELGARGAGSHPSGYDDALLLNTQGDVAEGSGANLFIVKNGTVITNEKDASIVLGITRDSVVQIARDLGLPMEVRPMTVNDLETADELFFSGTAVEITPIKEVDGRVIGDGTPGPITRRTSEDVLRRRARSRGAVPLVVGGRVGGIGHGGGPMSVSRSTVIACAMCFVAGAGVMWAQQQGGSRREPQFENSEMKVWKSIVMPKQPLTLHRHEHGRALVALTNGQLNVVDKDGKRLDQYKLTKGTAIWLGVDPPGQMHADVNDGTQPDRSDRRRAQERQEAVARVAATRDCGAWHEQTDRSILRYASPSCRVAVRPDGQGTDDPRPHHRRRHPCRQRGGARRPDDRPARRAHEDVEERAVRALRIA